MPQESQIHVFSTQLLNKAAEAVHQGQYPSINAYHCAQPETKRFLEHAVFFKSLKLNRQNPPIGKPYMRNPMGKNGPRQQNPMGVRQTQHPGMGSGQPQYPMMQQQSGNPQPNSHLMNELSPVIQIPGVNVLMQFLQERPHEEEKLAIIRTDLYGLLLPYLQQGPYLPEGTPSYDCMGPQPLLPFHIGVNVPVENLTPSQRWHQEEQLAKILRRFQMLLPDLQQDFPEKFPRSDLFQSLIQGLGGPIRQLMQQTIDNMKMHRGQQNMMMGPGNGPNPEHGPRGHLQPNKLLNHPSNTMMPRSKQNTDGSHGFCSTNPMGPSQQHPDAQCTMMSQQTSMALTSSKVAEMECYNLLEQFFEEQKMRLPGSKTNGSNGPMPAPMRPVENSGRMGPGGGGGGGGNGAGSGRNGPSTPIGGPPSQGLPTSWPGTPTRHFLGPPPSYHQSLRSPNPSSANAIGASPPPPYSYSSPSQSSQGLPTSWPGTPTRRFLGPSPPYHQTQKSPNPSSANAIGASSPPPYPYSSLSLSSQRMSSGLKSPADSSLGWPHPSPESLHNTPMNSPNPCPLSPNNPGTSASVGAPLQSPSLQHK